jgi:hypothetical protein
MEEVKVTVPFGVPIDLAFAAVSDHETFLRDARTTTRIAREGDADRNGLGCLREVSVKGAGTIVEEITGWQKPARFEYAIRKAPIPVKHEGGSVRFTSTKTGTDVEWTTRFTIPVPIVGRGLEKIAGGVFRGAFRSLLFAARAKLEGE